MSVIDKNVNKESVAENAPPRRRRRAPEAARENIMAAAEAMLISVGPQSLKLAEVAREAGVSNASVLHHFGSIEAVQTALMERMVRRLVERILALDSLAADSLAGAGEGIVAIFDAFETRGAARLAAWLVLTDQASRLTDVRVAVREAMAVRAARLSGIPPDLLEDFTLATITLALGVGLFGPTLGDIVGKPPGRARELALDLLLARVPRAP